ncbi:hypothetical protein [Nonomuraea turcica]|nr:hypothetical protein [Nonomuraea sp. G32]MDP4504076.1 hypothetical protein [Nonomuraea sp. G32]
MTKSLRRARACRVPPDTATLNTAEPLVWDICGAIAVSRPL